VRDQRECARNVGVVRSISVAARHDPWPEHGVEGVADVLGETSDGLTGTEMALLLERSKIDDVAPKRHEASQASKGAAWEAGERWCVQLRHPVRYGSDAARSLSRGAGYRPAGRLNEVLVYLGLRINDDGKVSRGVSQQS
jgi:hypothetical protein